MNGKKVWVEIDEKAIQKNIAQVRKLLKSTTKLFAVVKSNAYGHGLTLFSSRAEQYGVDGFCVDSLVEGMKLRAAGIRKPILVLGPTLPNGSLADAVSNDIAITISNDDALDRFIASKFKPKFHLKIDSGMHRQGFYVGDLPRVIKKIKSGSAKDYLVGVYTHFASAKDINYPTFTDEQVKVFTEACEMLSRAGFKNIIRHAAATGGTLINKKYHFDAVRIGIGLYGLWPSRELEIQLSSIRFEPVLSWRSLVSEVKMIPEGGYVGYDLAERVMRPTKMAVVPIGYWHGFDRGLSGLGEVLIRGRRARVLGRVSMDLIVVDATDIGVRVGDAVTLIGRDGKGAIAASEIAGKVSTSHYEFITRINPLIERITI
jgi:alanine racemase